MLDKTKEVTKLGVKIVEELDIDELPEWFQKKIVEKINDEQTDVESFQDRLSKAPNQELMLYVPDVYQKDIYKIDYLKLKALGIKLISFDIDDTISDSIKNKTIGVHMSKDAKELFQKLKLLGFTVTLLTNANSSVAIDACKQLKADGYIARANKPETMNFEVM